MTIENYEISIQERPSSPDILLGAYLISHLKTCCENCGATDTPQWRRGYYSEILGKYTNLCNKCGIKYNKNQFCLYCKYIYGKEQDKASNVWLTCNGCGRWSHIQCELSQGEEKFFSGC